VQGNSLILDEKTTDLSSLRVDRLPRQGSSVKAQLFLVQE
jgi:hypothetical protein